MEYWNDNGEGIPDHRPDMSIWWRLAIGLATFAFLAVMMLLALRH